VQTATAQGSNAATLLTAGRGRPLPGDLSRLQPTGVQFTECLQRRDIHRFCESKKFKEIEKLPI
jgi:hypothetical protein